MAAHKIGSFFSSQKIQDKIAKQHKIITIGVMGSSFGIGVTHLSLILGTYFNKTRTKTALVEWGNQMSFSYIEEAYEGTTNLTSSPFFTMKRIDFYKHYKEANLTSLKDGRYQVIIIDFGEFSDTGLRHLNEVDIPLFVAQSNEWKYKEIEKIFGLVAKEVYRQWKIIIPFGTKEEVKVLSSIYRNKMFSLSFHKDPFELTKEITTEIEKILGL